MLQFTVDGEPAPQGSKNFKGYRGGKPVLVESSKGLPGWRASVTAAARTAMRESRLRFPLEGPLELAAVFAVRAPKRRPREFPHVKPDIDKLLRAVLDSCTDAGVWGDDGQVVRLRDVLKVYPGAGTSLPAPGVHITITRYPREDL